MEDYEISVQELSKRDADSYILIDIRDDSSYSYGNIPGSLHVPKDILEADYEKYTAKDVRAALESICSIPGRYSIWFLRKDGSVSKRCFRSKASFDKYSESTKN